MKDLYLRLGLMDRTNDVANINNAIDMCMDDDVADSARGILLKEARKKYYDQHHQLLTLLGRVRAHVNVPPSAAWLGLENQDFDNVVIIESLDEEDSAESGNGVATVDDWSSRLDDGDLEEIVSSFPQSTRLRSRGDSFPVDPRVLLTVAVGTAGVCLLFLLMHAVMSAIFAGGGLPDHGSVEYFVDAPRNGRLRVVNQGSEPASVRLTSVTSGKDVTQMVIHGGETARAAIPADTYDVHFFVGDAEDWTGRSFDPPARHIRPHRDLKIEAEKEVELTIGKGTRR